MNRQTQANRILELLRDRGSVTNVELNQMDIFRYRDRIHELRRAGHRILSTRVRGGLWKFTLNEQKILTVVSYYDPLLHKTINKQEVLWA